MGQDYYDVLGIPRNADKNDIKKAFKALFIFWTCAIFSVFIPILHFILVPGFFIVGLFFAANAYSDDVCLKDDHVVCPKCGQKAIFKNLTDQFPKWATCVGCAAELRIEETKNSF